MFKLSNIARLVGRTTRLVGNTTVDNYMTLSKTIENTTVDISEPYLIHL